jgi:hypothetical protein
MMSHQEFHDFVDQALLATRIVGERSAIPLRAGGYIG